MSDTLPPIDGSVLVAAVDGLPARLRKKLDDAAGRFAGLAVVRDGDRFTVAVDEATTVTLLAEGGYVRSADSVTCTCLLAPNCLHRAGVLANAPTYSPDEPAAFRDHAEAGPGGDNAGGDGASSDGASGHGVGGDGDDRVGHGGAGEPIGAGPGGAGDAAAGGRSAGDGAGRCQVGGWPVGCGGWVGRWQVRCGWVGG
ncbi:hypothetical protein GCM10020218_092050 [Dactylosporangium vinaceum]